jgi:glucose-6-phosphate dehydrogenase assembly protein OpcA
LRNVFPHPTDTVSAKDEAMSDVTSWRELLTEEMKSHRETMTDIESITLTEAELDEKFDAGYGTAKGKAFTAWTAKRVYFPVVYDGAEWAASVPRHPNGEATGHEGGQ